MRHRQLKVMSL